MKKPALYIFLALMIPFMAAAAWLGLNEYRVDKEASSLGFSIRNGLGRVKGSLGKYDAELKFDPGNLSASSFSATVDVSSINTGIKMRDKHLRSDDYFDVEKYPQMRFRSERFERTADGYVVHGKLTIKDVTKDISIPFSFRPEGDKAVFEGHFTLLRRDYHVGGKPFMMGNEVEVDIRLHTAKQ